MRLVAGSQLLLATAAVLASAAIGLATGTVGPIPIFGLLAAAGGFAVLLATGWELAVLLLAVSFFISVGVVGVGSGVYAPLIWGSVALMITASVIRGVLVEALQNREVRRAFLLLSGWVLLLGLSSVSSPVVSHSTLITVLFGLFLIYLAATAGLAVSGDPQRLSTVLILISTMGAAILLLRLAQAGELSTIVTFGDLNRAKQTSTSEVGNLNSFGYVLMLGVPLAVAQLLTSRSRAVSAVTAAALALIVVGLLGTVSRSAMIGALSGILVAFLLLARLSPGRVAAVVLPSAAAITYLASASDAFSSGALGYASAGYHGRSELWSLALDLWRQRPLLGHGPGTWDAIAGGVGGEAHSIVLSTLVSGGVITLALAVAIVAYLVRLGVGASRRFAQSGPAAAGVAAGATGAFVAMFTRGAFESSGPFDMRHWFTILGWTVIALILACWARATADAS